MHEIKNTMSGNRRRYQPEILLEADNRNHREPAGRCNFHDERRTGRSHYREQYIIGGDHDKQSRIERAVPIHAENGSRARYSERPVSTQPRIPSYSASRIIFGTA